MPSDLTLGAEYNFDGLKDVILGYDRHFKQDVHIGSFFFQNEWKRQWGFLVGGRLDKHNLVDNIIFSPRANLRYNPTDNLNFRLTYAGGFRAPQAFDEDLHVGVVGRRTACHRPCRQVEGRSVRTASASPPTFIISLEMYRPTSSWKAFIPTSTTCSPSASSTGRTPKGTPYRNGTTPTEPRCSV